MRIKYKHIFFDLDNTLWDFKTNSFYALKETYHNFFSGEKEDASFEKFYDVYNVHNSMLWRGYRKKTISKKELIRRRFQNTFDDLKLEGQDPEIVNSFYLDEMPKQIHLVQGALELLNYLNLKKYKMYIITNGFREVQNKKLENTGLKSFFQKIFISEDIKIPKPGIEIFEHAIKSANAKKSESLMIGDDWDADIVGAANFGIDQAYYAKNDVAKNTLSFSNKLITHRVNQLIELKNIL